MPKILDIIEQALGALRTKAGSLPADVEAKIAEALAPAKEAEAKIEAAVELLVVAGYSVVKASAATPVAEAPAAAPAPAAA